MFLARSLWPPQRKRLLSSPNAQGTDGTAAVLQFAALMREPMIYKTFDGWKRHTVMRKFEHEQQREINETIAKREQERKSRRESEAQPDLTEASVTRQKSRKPKAQAIDHAEAESIQQHIAMKERQRAAVREAQRSKRSSAKCLTAEQQRVRDERLVYEGLTRDRYGSDAQGEPPLRRRPAATREAPKWSGILQTLKDAGMVEQQRFRIQDIFTFSKQQQREQPGKPGGTAEAHGHLSSMANSETGPNPGLADGEVAHSAWGRAMKRQRSPGSSQPNATPWQGARGGPLLMTGFPKPTVV